jgi:hypothetical protein
VFADGDENIHVQTYGWTDHIKKYADYKAPPLSPPYPPGTVAIQGLAAAMLSADSITTAALMWDNIVRVTRFDKNFGVVEGSGAGITEGSPLIAAYPLKFVGAVDTIVAVRGSAGLLTVSSWSFNEPGGLKSVDVAHDTPVTDVALTDIRHYSHAFATATRNAETLNLDVTVWEVDEHTGALSRKASLSAGPVNQVSACASPLGLVTACVTPDQRLELRSWSIKRSTPGSM